MSLCPEFEQRAAMDEYEFWARVLERDAPLYTDPADVAEIDPQVSGGGPCPECGETGACAWDAEGRPLIHALGAEADR